MVLGMWAQSVWLGSSLGSAGLRSWPGSWCSPRAPIPEAHILQSYPVLIPGMWHVAVGEHRCASAGQPFSHKAFGRPALNSMSGSEKPVLTELVFQMITQLVCGGRALSPSQQ